MNTALITTQIITGINDVFDYEDVFSPQPGELVATHDFDVARGLVVFVALQPDEVHFNRDIRLRSNRVDLFDFLQELAEKSEGTGEGAFFWKGSKILMTDSILESTPLCIRYL